MVGPAQEGHVGYNQGQYLSLISKLPRKSRVLVFMELPAWHSLEIQGVEQRHKSTVSLLQTVETSLGHLLGNTEARKKNNLMDQKLQTNRQAF